MWAYFIFSFGFEIMHPLLSCSRMQCTCRCGSVHISLTHTTRSLIACSLACSLAHSHSGTQSGGGTLTSRWLSRSSHHTLLAFSLARSPVCVPVSLPCVTVCRPGSRSRVCAGSETSRVSGELQLRQYNYNCVSNGHT